MPTQAEDHAWRDHRTPSARLATLPDLPRPVPGGRAYEGIGRILAAAVEDRAFRQGEKLPAAAPIADRFGVSVDTARAAVRWLIADGYAQRRPGGATYVTGPRIPF